MKGKGSQTQVVTLYHKTPCTEHFIADFVKSRWKVKSRFFSFKFIEKKKLSEHFHIGDFMMS